MRRCPRTRIGGAADTQVLGALFRDILKLNRKHRNFRIFGPDETLSNRLNAVFEVTQRQWEASHWNKMNFLLPMDKLWKS